MAEKTLTPKQAREHVREQLHDILESYEAIEEYARLLRAAAEEDPPEGVDGELLQRYLPWEIVRNAEVIRGAHLELMDQLGIGATIYDHGDSETPFLRWRSKPLKKANPKPRARGAT